MTRNKFEEQLSELKDLLTRMGELNCEAIGDAVTALETQNTALAKQREAALPWLEALRLPAWVHNKTIQKAVESRRISPEDKEYLRTLKLGRA